MTRRAFTDAEGLATVRAAVNLAIAEGRDAAETFLRDSGIGGGEAYYVLLFIDYHLHVEMEQRKLETRTISWDSWPEEIQMLLAYYLGLPSGS
jgi:hypothetical protein